MPMDSYHLDTPTTGIARWPAHGFNQPSFFDLYSMANGAIRFVTCGHSWKWLNGWDLQKPANPLDRLDYAITIEWISAVQITTSTYGAHLLGVCTPYHTPSGYTGSKSVFVGAMFDRSGTNYNYLNAVAGLRNENDGAYTFIINNADYSTGPQVIGTKHSIKIELFVTKITASPMLSSLKMLISMDGVLRSTTELVKDSCFASLLTQGVKPWYAHYGGNVEPYVNLHDCWKVTMS